jgi:hypothetical protein
MHSGLFLFTHHCFASLFELVDFRRENEIAFGERVDLFVAFAPYRSRGGFVSCAETTVRVPSKIPLRILQVENFLFGSRNIAFSSYNAFPY